MLTLNTNEKAPSGDHEIGLALSYSSSGHIEVAKAVVKVHIKNWSERHDRIVTGAIIATIPSLVVGVAALLLR